MGGKMVKKMYFVNNLFNFIRGKMYSQTHLFIILGKLGSLE